MSLHTVIILTKNKKETKKRKKNPLRSYISIFLLDSLHTILYLIFLFTSAEVIFSSIYVYLMNLCFLFTTMRFNNEYRTVVCHFVWYVIRSVLEYWDYTSIGSTRHFSNSGVRFRRFLLIRTYVTRIQSVKKRSIYLLY